MNLGDLQAHVLRLPDPDQRSGRIEMRSVIDALTDGVLRPVAELCKLGRTMARRACDVLAYLDRPRTSNGPIAGVDG